MTPAEIETLRKLCDAAQDGPWREGPFSSDVWGPSAKGGETKIADIRGWGYLTGKGNGALGLPNGEAIAIQTENCAFIAAAREAIPKLLDEVESLRRQLADAAEPDTPDECPLCGKTESHSHGI